MAGMTASSKGDLTAFRAVDVREKCRFPSTLDDDDDAPGLEYDLGAPDPELEPPLPADIFCFPFLLALWTLRSVALVTLRKTRSKSSLYPGHCFLALRH